MATGIKEIDFEQAIETYLTSSAGGYRAVSPTLYDRDLALAPAEAVAFVRDSRPERYQALQDQYGPQTDERIVHELTRQIKAHGTLHVLRKGYKDRGVEMRWAWFKPASGLNSGHAAWYAANRFAVARQVRYAKSTKDTQELDMILFLNGIPLLTAELKNASTGQYLTDAIKQYRLNRDPKEPLLEYKRCLVHFAVSTEKVAMTTRLALDKTFFLPFNQDIDNPVNLNGFTTEYLWTDVWSRDSLLDLVQNFVNVQTETETYFDEKTGKLAERQSEKLIFPRFHQRRAIGRLLEAVRADGVGQKYLIKHSAGSGKSNTISWLAHRLAGFFETYATNRPMFDSVIVVTDRRMLDKQLRKNVQDFGQVAGTVVAIDESMSSVDLQKAIEAGKRIIITTLQKFPVISDTIARLGDRRYAVIIDEAHSSQSGEAARHLRRALSLSEAETEDESEATEIDELVLADLKSRGPQRNVSFFAFTATPKPKTTELFGTLWNGQKVPFDEYTMRQAITEGFILNVLENYTSFRRYYKLASRTGITDKEYETAKTVRLLTSYVDLTDHAIELKTRIMLEHFIGHTAKQIGGKARAMLVTRSRLHAVRYKRKFDELMREMNLPYNALVAFSGTVHDAEVGADFTESNMNNLGGKLDISLALKLPQYRLLIVANKYQTGFDEPLLHTMFVDKKLGGVNTVQTLSRLNRTMTGKTSTMVLDFVNDPEQIQADFQEYYDANFMPEDRQTDPNTLYDILTELAGWTVIRPNDIAEFAEIYFRPGDNKELLQPILERCAKRFRDELDDDNQVAFKSCATDFVRLYRFVSQILTFQDVELEKTYALLSMLIKKLPMPGSTLPREVLNEVELDSYKIQNLGTLLLPLAAAPAEQYGLNRGSSSGAGADEVYELLSSIIKTLNDTYGLDLTENDKVDFDLIRQRIEADPELMTIFTDRNSKENIRDKFNDVLDQALLDFIDTKLELYNKLSEDKANATMKRLWFNSLYDLRIRGLRP